MIHCAFYGNDVQQFGINPLTGEACAYGMRLLCDVNDEGRALVARFFSLPDLSLSANWNSTVNGQRATGSVMLTRDTLWDLVEFAMLDQGCIAVLRSNGGMVGFGAHDTEALDAYRQMTNPSDDPSLRWRYAPTGGQPRVGDRNVHGMSGRAQ